MTSKIKSFWLQNFKFISVTMEIMSRSVLNKQLKYYSALWYRESLKESIHHTFSPKLILYLNLDMGLLKMSEFALHISQTFRIVVWSFSDGRIYHKKLPLISRLVIIFCTKFLYSAFVGSWEEAQDVKVALVQILHENKKLNCKNV
jgi:hypothetical protein